MLWVSIQADTTAGSPVPNGLGGPGVRRLPTASCSIPADPTASCIPPGSRVSPVRYDRLAPHSVSITPRGSTGVRPRLRTRGAISVRPSRPSDIQRKAPAASPARSPFTSRSRSPRRSARAVPNYSGLAARRRSAPSTPTAASAVTHARSTPSDRRHGRSGPRGGHRRRYPRV